MCPEWILRVCFAGHRRDRSARDRGSPKVVGVDGDEHGELEEPADFLIGYRRRGVQKEVSYGPLLDVHVRKPRPSARQLAEFCVGHLQQSGYESGVVM